MVIAEIEERNDAVIEHSLSDVVANADPEHCFLLRTRGSVATDERSSQRATRGAIK